MEYINYLTGFTQDSATGEWKPDSSIQAIPVWKEIAKLPLGTLQISQVPVKREEGWICLTATGLNIIGRIGHQLFANAALQQNWKQQYAAKVADPQTIDWKRSAPMWQSNIVQGNKLLT